ncbi:threonine/serine exporter family protein, partial [Streptomyces sp. JAC128]
APGSATYFGLLGVAQTEVDPGPPSLFTAVATALAIAIGGNLGSEISRLFMRVLGAVQRPSRRSAKRTRGV